MNVDVVIRRAVRLGLVAARGAVVREELEADERHVVLDVPTEARDVGEHLVAEDAGDHEGQGGLLHLMTDHVVCGVLVMSTGLVGAPRPDLATAAEDAGVIPKTADIDAPDPLGLGVDEAVGEDDELVLPGILGPGWGEMNKILELMNPYLSNLRR